MVLYLHPLSLDPAEQEFGITEYPMVKFFGADKLAAPQRFSQIAGSEAMLVQFATAQWEAQTPPAPVRSCEPQIHPKKALVSQNGEGYPDVNPSNFLVTFIQFHRFQFHG